MHGNPSMMTLLSKLTKKRTLAEEIIQARQSPGWAVKLRPDAGTFHTANSDKAASFQSRFSEIKQCVGWSTSHMCLMNIIASFGSNLPRTYLEIGVNEGLSAFTLVT